MMTYDPAALALGNAAALRTWAADLDVIAGACAASYARQTRHRLGRVRPWMQETTWMTAEEALALSFADAVEGREAPEAVARFDYGRFRHAPEALVRMARENGWAPVGPSLKAGT